MLRSSIAHTPLRHKTTYSSDATFTTSTYAPALGYAAEYEVDIVCAPSFAEVSIDSQGRTAIKLGVIGR